jgi:hypothetical protein
MIELSMKNAVNGNAPEQLIKKFTEFPAGSSSVDIHKKLLTSTVEKSQWNIFILLLNSIKKKGIFSDVQVLEASLLEVLKRANVKVLNATLSSGIYTKMVVQRVMESFRRSLNILGFHHSGYKEKMHILGNMVNCSGQYCLLTGG